MQLLPRYKFKLLHFINKDEFYFKIMIEVYIYIYIYAAFKKLC